MGKFIREKWRQLIRKTENFHNPGKEVQFSLSSIFLFTGVIMHICYLVRGKTSFSLFRFFSFQSIMGCCFYFLMFYYYYFSGQGVR